MASAIATLNDLGQSPWYDNLARVLLQEAAGAGRSGLRALVEDDGIRGVTSNPTIFQKAMAAGEGYDHQVAECARAGSSLEETYWALVVDDVTAAADVLAPVHTATGGADGFVSVEVSPDLADDTAATMAQAEVLFGRIGRPNVMIKIPATPAGLPAISETLARGINVNVTLIFSLARYEAVVDAYLEGLDRLVASGAAPSKVASVASLFVSRVDTETDRRLPDGHPLRGRAAVANAKVAYSRFRARFDGPRWEALAARGARFQRPLWASTSTKNPEYSPTLYVDELVGRDTVNTLAPASIDALRGGLATLRADAIGDGVDEANGVLAALADAHVDFDDVTAVLEREGVAAFAASYHSAMETLASRRALLTR